MSNGAVGDSRWQSTMMAKTTGDNKYGDGFRMMEVVSSFCICATCRHILGQPFSKPQDTRRGYSTLPNSYFIDHTTWYKRLSGKDSHTKHRVIHLLTDIQGAPSSAIQLRN